MKIVRELRTAVALILRTIERLPEGTAYYVHLDESIDSEHPIQFDIATKNLDHYDAVLAALGEPHGRGYQTIDVSRTHGWLRTTIERPEE